MRIFSSIMTFFTKAQCDLRWWFSKVHLIMIPFQLGYTNTLSKSYVWINQWSVTLINYPCHPEDRNLLCNKAIHVYIYTIQWPAVCWVPSILMDAITAKTLKQVPYMSAICCKHILFIHYMTPSIYLTITYPLSIDGNLKYPIYLVKYNYSVVIGACCHLYDLLVAYGVYISTTTILSYLIKRSLKIPNKIIKYPLY